MVDRYDKSVPTMISPQHLARRIMFSGLVYKKMDSQKGIIVYQFEQSKIKEVLNDFDYIRKYCKQRQVFLSSFSLNVNDISKCKTEIEEFVKQHGLIMEWKNPLIISVPNDDKIEASD